MYKYIEVVHTTTGTVVKRIDVTGSSERQIEKVEMGLLRNMNLDSYHTNDAESESPLETEPKVTDKL
jgi:hypothetical protein